MIERGRLRCLALAAVALCGAAAGAQPALKPAAGTVGADERARTYFTDTTLLAQDGRSLRFYSDVLRDRVVLINFVFTECGDSCPLTTQRLLQARQLLGDLASQVRYVSISIDPERDTPQTLTQFAGKQGALDPSWLWLTGAKANVEAVTRRLGAHTDNPQNHLTGLILGNVRTEQWMKMRPDASPRQIAAQLRRLAGAQEPTAVGRAPVAAGTGMR